MVCPKLRRPRITNCILPLAAVLALLLVGHGFGYVKWADKLGQPAQMWSKVDYDPKLSDPFFDADDWTCPHGPMEGAKCRNGKYVRILKNPCESSRKEPRIWLDQEWTCPDGCKKCAICKDGAPVVKSTAKCVSNSHGKNRVSFCEAKLTDAKTIDLFIHTDAGLFCDRLRIQIIDGYFTCQYSTKYLAAIVGGLIWTTKQQKLTLDRKEYHRGDVIKGKIEFECIEKPRDPEYLKEKLWYEKNIKVYGVFKTILR
ncbi:MAG: hypothetical protein V1792_11645 [Pseudomonadota bacterium]